MLPAAPSHRAPSCRRGPPQRLLRGGRGAARARGPCRGGRAGTGVVSMRWTNQDGSKLLTPLLCCHGRALAQRPPPFSWRQTTMATSQVQPVGRRKWQGRQEKSLLLALLHHCIPPVVQEELACLL